MAGKISSSGPSVGEVSQHSVRYPVGWAASLSSLSLMEAGKISVKSEPERTLEEGTQEQGRGVSSQEVYWRGFEQEDMASRLAVWRRRCIQRRKRCGARGGGGGGRGDEAGYCGWGKISPNIKGTDYSVPVASVRGLEHHNPNMSTLWVHVSR